MLLSWLKRWWYGNKGDGDLLTEGLLVRHNSYRLAPALTLDARLAHLAQRQAAWMARHHHLTHNQVLDNKSHDFDMRMRLEKLICSNAGQTVSAGQSTIEEVWYTWASVPRSRANILCPYYTHVGLGTALDGRSQRYWCAVYADLVTPLAPGRGPTYNCPGLEGLDDRPPGGDYVNF